MEDYIIRLIEPKDNASLAKIIRSALEEFNANKPGTVYFDASTDHLFELFSTTPNAVYFVAESNGILLGGAGIYHTEGLPEGVCELVKMYLHQNARGKGLGGLLISTCLKEAAKMGYRKVYLETMPELQKAVTVYEKFGFKYLNAPIGHSGHTGCNIWMMKSI